MAGSNDLDYTLPPQAYEPLGPGETYQPVVPDGADVPEFTFKAVLVGVVVGVIFGAANAYLGLKVGLTVSASIPAAVIGVAIFRAMRSGSLLETNIVQTIGSAGESLAAGVIFTLPVLYLWGETPGFWPIFPLALIGGLLGVLFMVPLRKFLIVQEHGKLTYPEGTACAEVQVASQAGGDQARLLFTGMGIGALYQGLQKWLHFWSEEPDIPINAPGYRTSFGGSLTPELLGVGFIIGPRVAAVMMAGGAVGWLVIIPLLYLFGENSATPIAPEMTELIRNMDHWTVWSRYLRYIGAGAVAFGGLFTLIKSTPVLIESFRLALGNFGGGAGEARRTEQELSIKTVLLGLLVLAMLASFLPLMEWTEAGGKTQMGMIGPLAGLAVVVFAFFFVTVSSRIVGLIGSSSNPISGMTIATVLLCALLFGGAYGPAQAKVAVLTIGALVCIAAAIAGDTSQDLKTGFLVGATPKQQQIGEIIGVIAAAIAMSTVLALFKEPIIDGTFKAPQANLIKLVIDGVLDGNLPWGLVFVGIAMAATVEMLGLPTLAFAVGLYLPIHLATPILVGGLVRWMVQRRSPKKELAERRENGVLYASGLIAGAAMIGVVAAAATWITSDWTPEGGAGSLLHSFFGFFAGSVKLIDEPFASWFAWVVFFGLATSMLYVALGRRVRHGG